MLDSTSPVPIHHQLAELLRSEIDAGRYPPGVRLPTEEELCVHHGVSRTPVRKALGTLVAEGRIVRYRRRGSFVADDAQPTDDLDIIVRDDVAAEWERLVHRIAAGMAPDAALVPATWVAGLVALGAIVPLDLEPDPIEILAVPDPVAAMWERGDLTYAVPVAVELHGLWLRRSALEVIGDRPPGVWGDLRTLAVAARDLDAEVSSPIVLPARSSGSRPASMTAWLLLAAAGVGFGGAGPLTVASAGGSVFTFLRRLIDTGLMSPDVVKYDTTDVVSDLRTGRAVAGVAPADAMVDDGEWLFTGFPGSGRTGIETATLARCTVGVVMRQSARPDAAAHRLDHIRSTRLRPIDAGLSATVHAPPAIRHHVAFAAATADLMDDVISGRSTVDAAVARFSVVADLLGS